MTQPSQILFLQPWIEDFYATDCRVQPIGLAYLAGSLRARFADLDVQLYDALAGGSKRSIPWPREFDYLKRYYGHPDKGPFSLFHHYYRFGHSDATILRRLATYRPSLIGISALFTPYYRQSLALARLCRRVFPTVPIVMGGHHATMHPATLLHPSPPFDDAEPLCDVVLRGECEESIVALVSALRGERSLDGIPGLLTREAGSGPAAEPVTPCRAAIPEPEFRGLDPAHYTYGRRPMTFIITSRSCPHRCSFCSIHAVFGTRYETREVDAVVAEIRRRYAEGIRHFDFEDDNFTYHRDHALALLDRLIAMQLPISLSAMNGISYRSLDADLLERMHSAGFETLNLSLVSSDPDVLAFTGRPHRVEHFTDVMEAAGRLGLRTTAYCILGMPGQTVDSMWSTLCMLARTRCLVGASPFYFTPGSPIHVRNRDAADIRLASAGRDPYFSARLTTLDLETREFDRDDVYTLFRLARVINSIKEGLDRGCAPDDPVFEPARRVLRERRWFARCGGGDVELPFSRNVAERIARGPVVVRGYRTDREGVFTT